jgi:hypothetical protein
MKLFQCFSRKIIVDESNASFCEIEEEENEDTDKVNMVSIKKLVRTSQKLNERQIAVLRRSSKGTLTAIVAESIRIKTNHVLDNHQIGIINQCSKEVLVNIITEKDGFK